MQENDINIPPELIGLSNSVLGEGSLKFKTNNNRWICASNVH